MKALLRHSTSLTLTETITVQKTTISYVDLHTIYCHEPRAFRLGSLQKSPTTDSFESLQKGSHGRVGNVVGVDEVLTQAPHKPASSREEEDASPGARGCCFGLEQPHRYGPKIQVSYHQSSILLYSHTALQ